MISRENEHGRFKNTCEVGNLTNTDNEKVLKALERGTLDMLDGFYGVSTASDDNGTDLHLNNYESNKGVSLAHVYDGVYGFIVAKNCVKRSSIKNAPEPFGMIKNSGN